MMHDMGEMMAELMRNNGLSESGSAGQHCCKDQPARG